MISVSVYKQSNYPVSAKKVRAALRKLLEKEGIVSESEVSVAVVGRKKVTSLVQKYFTEPPNLASSHPVLSFPASETKKPFIYPPDGKIHLGEIVISYPQAVELAKKKGKLLDEVVCELAKHGALHLLGRHHE